MGRERARQRQYFHFCLALLIWLSGCSLWQESTRQRDLRAAVQTGNRLLAEGNFDGSLSAFEGVAAAARNEPPGDAAVYKSGLIYAHPDNPKRDLHKAHEKFAHLLSAYPASPWVEQARVWVELLKESEEWKREAEQSRKAVERWQLELEKNRLALEKSRQEVERSRLELDRAKQEMEKTKQLIEKSKQVDIEIDQKRRDRVR